MADPERGLRGVISAILIFEAITILLGIRVIQQTSPIGETAGTVGVTVVIVLAVAHVLACALVRRRILTPVVAVLQVLLIACWYFSAAVGVMGIVFAVVWAVVAWARREFRRALAARTASDPSAG